LLKSCGAEEAPSDPSTPWQLAHWATNSFDKADFLGVAQISIEIELLDELELDERELEELEELLEERDELAKLMLDELLELEALTLLIELDEPLELEVFDELADELVDELDELDTLVGEVLGTLLSSPLVQATSSESDRVSAVTVSLRENVIVLVPLLVLVLVSQSNTERR
jgi:hypothetical protein